MIAIILLYIVLPVVQIYLYFSSNFIFDLIEGLNFIASITSLHWMLSNVLIAAKVPWIQRVIPYDKRIKTHIFFSIGMLVFIIYHGIYKFALGYSIGVTTIPFNIFLSMVILLALFWIPLPGIKRLKVKLIEDYEINNRIHVVAQPIIGVLLFIHIYSSGLFHDVSILSRALYLGLFILSYSLFCLSKTPIFRRNCKVTSVEKLGDIVLLQLHSKRALRYKSGQFTFLGYKNLAGRVEEHPFSFLSNGDDVSRADFGIKMLGDFTTSLSHLKVGDHIWLRGSYGNFRPNLNSKSPIMLIGSGIGIVPFISIVKEFLGSGFECEIDLFLAVNSRDELLDSSFLERADKAFKFLHIHYLIYKEDGLLFSSEYFKSKLNHPERSSVYICSSPGVRNIVINCLKELGVKKSKIHYEAFSF